MIIMNNKQMHDEHNEEEGKRITEPYNNIIIGSNEE